jgi:hypothetical protein
LSAISPANAINPSLKPPFIACFDGACPDTVLRDRSGAKWLNRFAAALDLTNRAKTGKSGHISVPNLFVCLNVQKDAV